MAAYKDEERGTWYVSFYYEDWTGAKKRKVKRGFRTKKEALNFEAEYDKWVRTRMEMNPAREWYLVGTPYCGDLEYVQARIPE